MPPQKRVRPTKVDSKDSPEAARRYAEDVGTRSGEKGETLAQLQKRCEAEGFDAITIRAAVDGWNRAMTAKLRRESYIPPTVKTDRPKTRDQ